MYKSFTFKRVITLFIAFIFIFASVEHFMFFASNSPELPQMLALTNTDNNNYPQRDTDYLSFTVYGDVLSVYHAQVQRLDGSIWQDIGTLANGIITIVNTAPYHAHVNFTIPSNILEDHDRIFVQMTTDGIEVSAAIFDVFVYNVTFVTHGGIPVNNQRIFGISGFTLLTSDGGGGGLPGGDSPSENSTDDSSDAPSENSTDESIDTSPENSTDESTDTPSENSTDESTDTPSENSSDESTDAPSENSTDASTLAPVTVSWNTVSSLNTTGSHSINSNPRPYSFASIEITDPNGDTDVVILTNGSTIDIEIGSKVSITPMIALIYQTVGFAGFGNPAFRIMSYEVNGDMTILARLENEEVIEYPGTGVISEIITDDGLDVFYTVEEQFWYRVWQGIYFPGIGWILMGEHPNSPIGPFIAGQNVPPLIVPFGPEPIHSSAYNTIDDTTKETDDYSYHEIPDDIPTDTDQPTIPDSPSDTTYPTDEPTQYEPAATYPTDSTDSTPDDATDNDTSTIGAYFTIPTQDFGAIGFNLGRASFSIGAVTVHAATAAEQIYRPAVLVYAPNETNRSGFVFTGWYDAQSNGTAWDFANRTITGDVTIHAYWTATETNLQDDPTTGLTDDPTPPLTEPTDPTEPNTETDPTTDGSDNITEYVADNTTEDATDDTTNDITDAPTTSAPDTPIIPDILSEPNTPDDDTMVDTPQSPSGEITSNTPPLPSTPGNILIPSEDGLTWFEFDEAGVPLGAWIWDDDEGVWIFDENVPLGAFPTAPVAIAAAVASVASMPQTGLTRLIGCNLMILGFALTIAVTAFIMIRHDKAIIAERRKRR